MKNVKVLLTGVTGFLGSHTAIQLLEKGYSVIGTVRDMDRVGAIKKIIAAHTSKSENLSFVKADLKDDSIWPAITTGIDYIQHIASPFLVTLPKKPEDLIGPATNGTVNILKAASANGVKRVIVTSSSSAIIYGRQKNERSGTYDETHWTDENNMEDLTPYFLSKTLAEKAAWKFMESDRSGMELSVVCPGAILGPVLEKDYGISASMVVKTMDGSSPALPNIGFEIVDVRSVADLLIRAMELPQAANQRYIATAGYMKFKDIAGVIKTAFPERKLPSLVIPDFMVRLFSNIEKSLKTILVDLSVERKLNNRKAIEELSWAPITTEEAVLSCAKSVVELGIVK
ncbi:MAG: NAD-dependent epimerase/dehydratase family protein [Cyclobacteriaceae bacterium]|nr:NAD-dependent epimerase/dehydratase family protein [Cyclobacteriaceae bacterium]